MLNLPADQARVLVLGVPGGPPPDEEIRAVEGRVRMSPGAEPLAFLPHPRVSEDEIRAALTRDKPVVVHLVRGGSQAGGAGDDRLTALLGMREGRPRVVVLSCCFEPSRAEAAARTIDCVVGTGAGISAEANAAFLGAFYAGLAAGRAVQQAFDLARLAVGGLSVPRDDAPRLVVRAGVDAGQVYPVKAATFDGPFVGPFETLNTGGSPRRGATVTRYTDIACPRRVWVETPRVSVVVRLTVEMSRASATVEEMQVDVSKPVRVRVQAPGFDLLREDCQDVRVPADADSEPAVFELKPRQVGHTSLTFDFFQGSQPIGTAVAPVEITAFEVVEGAEARTTRPLRFEGEVTPPEMVLHVAVQGTPAALVFSLIRDGGAWWRTYPPVAMEGRPEALAGQMYRDLARLVAGQDPTAAEVGGRRLLLAAEEVERRVRQMGQNLWKKLLPAELKALYAKEREEWRGKTMLIYSDEPHLPWELVWPYDDERSAWKDEEPWCVRLNLTRWLRKDPRGNGNEAPPGRLAVGALAVLAPAYEGLPDLAGARAERQALDELAAARRVRDVGPAVPTWTAVLDLLEGGQYDWLHAAAHGSFHADNPEGDSALWLEKDRALTPDALVGPEIEGHLRRKRPGFVFNACQVGRQGYALTRIGGWANTLVSAGAGLFVGPLWEVSDRGALKFAGELYRALFDGETVAQAVRRARLAARQAGDPTWLAYSVFAHPNARVRVGEA